MAVEDVASMLLLIVEHVCDSVRHHVQLELYGFIKNFEYLKLSKLSIMMLNVLTQLGFNHQEPRPFAPSVFERSEEFSLSYRDKVCAILELFWSGILDWQL